MTEPSITCLCMTWGDHPHLLCETIESFLRQDYSNRKMIVINTHPSPVVLDKEYQGVNVRNLDSDFDRLAEKLRYSTGLVDTEFWCHMDDDDIYLPGYLTALVAMVDKKPNALGWCNDHKFFLRSRDGDYVYQDNAWQWNSSLFRKVVTVSENAVSRPNFDQVLIYELAQSKQYVNYKATKKPTYIYRWDTGSWHYSGSGGNAEIINSFKAQVNAKENKEKIVPRWDKDYVAEVNAFWERRAA